MKIERYVSVVQRRRLGMDESVAHLFALIEPLFMIDTHMSFDERVWLFMLMWKLPSGFVAGEVGSYLGASTALIAAAASCKGGHVHAVDTWLNDSMDGEPAEDTFTRFLENTAGFRHLITPHRGRAEEVSAQMPPVDALFIDGDHSYEGVRRNLRDYAAKVHPGGLLVLHDFNRDDVVRAVADHFGAEQLTPVARVETLQAFQLAQPAG